MIDLVCGHYNTKDSVLSQALHEQIGHGTTQSPTRTCLVASTIEYEEGSVLLNLFLSNGAYYEPIRDSLGHPLASPPNARSVVSIQSEVAHGQPRAEGHRVGLYCIPTSSTELCSADPDGKYIDEALYQQTRRCLLVPLCLETSELWE